MAYDFKKEQKELYLPSRAPGILTVPPMNFLAVRGQGDPNQEGGEYQQAIGLLYGVAFTLKMSEKAGHRIPGSFAYVVPPLEGLWWQPGAQELDLDHKERLAWISMIRLPDFVDRSEFDWAVAQATTKKKMDFSRVEFFRYEEGLCVQCMHIGPYDTEPETLRRMEEQAAAQGYLPDLTADRLHHEIYLSDPRRTSPEKMRTVLRHPVRRGE